MSTTSEPDYDLIIEMNVQYYSRLADIPTRFNHVCFSYLDIKSRCDVYYYYGDDENISNMITNVLELCNNLVKLELNHIKVPFELPDNLNVMTLEIRDCYNFGYLPSMDKLEYLEMNWCKNKILHLDGIDYPNLSDLILRDCKIENIEINRSRLDYINLESCRQLLNVNIDTLCECNLRINECYKLRYIVGIKKLSNYTLFHNSELFMVGGLHKENISKDNCRIHECRKLKPDIFEKVLKIQNWFRRGKKQTFKRWIKSRDFNEWIYDPNELGGRITKKSLSNMFL